MSNKKFTASKEDKEEAGNRLKEILFGGKNDDAVKEWLRDYLEDRAPGVEKILASDKDEDADEIADEELPRTLVDMFTSEIFEGEYGYRLRDKILTILLEKGEYKIIRHIWEGSSVAKKNVVEDMKKKFAKNKLEVATQLVKCLEDHQRHPWRPGGPYAERFVSELRLPRIFAGIKSSGRPSRLVEAVPKADIKDLKPFQKNMQKQIENILNRSGEETRAIVTLPTFAIYFVTHLRYHSPHPPDFITTPLGFFHQTRHLQ